jgi:Tol biopolymer transport system component
MSFAFGQKGGCKMKVFQVPMLAMSLVGLGLLSGLDAPPARADFTFGEPVNVTTVIPCIDAMNDLISSFSSDGLEIYLDSVRPGGYGWEDAWVIRRDSILADWVGPENLGPAVSDPCGAPIPCISADGLELYFCSGRPGGQGGSDLYMSTRPTKNDPWGQAVNLGPKVNSSNNDGVPVISPDGLELYFTSDRPGGYGGWDLYVSKRATEKDPWGSAANLGPVVNSVDDDCGPGLSPDGLLLIFQDSSGTPSRPGGYGGSDIWISRRASLSDPWGPPVNLGPKINGPQFEMLARISPDGSWLYWSWANDDWTVFDNWRAPILPIVDFNGDGKVDLTDLVMLIQNWGTNNAHYDIGPYAWGDGKVDMEDLKIFMTYYEKENPPVQP